VLTIGYEDALYGPVDAADAQDWKDYFGLEFPVLIDDGSLYTDYLMSDSGRPLYVLIDRDMIVRFRGLVYVGHNGANANIPGLL